MCEYGRAVYVSRLLGFCKSMFHSLELDAAGAILLWQSVPPKMCFNFIIRPLTGMLTSAGISCSVFKTITKYYLFCIINSATCSRVMGCLFGVLIVFYLLIFNFFLPEENNISEDKKGMMFLFKYKYLRPRLGSSNLKSC